MRNYILIFFTAFFLPGFIFAQNDTTSITQSLIQQVLQENSNQENPSQDINKNQFAIKEPASPTIEKNVQKSEKSRNQKQTKQSIAGHIFTGENEFFSGVLYLKDFSLIITNEYKNKEFIKELPLSDIKSITCIQWDSYPLQKENHSFQFICSLYNIKDSSGYNFVYSKPIPAIQKILFQGNAGTTAFYSYFIDYDKDNKWENLQMPSAINNTKTPLQGVIRTIQFGKLDKNDIKTMDSIPVVIPNKNTSKNSNIKPQVKSKQKKQISKKTPQKPIKQQTANNKNKTNSTTKPITPKKPIHKQNQVSKKTPQKKPIKKKVNSNEEEHIRSRR